MPVNPIPDGYPAVIPYLMVKDAAQFIAFMQSVFDARLTEQMMRPNGEIGHSELRIGDSMIMLSEATKVHPATPLMLYFYVKDVDAVFKSAIAAGASVLCEPADQPYGDRSGGCLEPSGNTIWIATPTEDVSPAALRRRAETQYKG